MAVSHHVITPLRESDHFVWIIYLGAPTIGIVAVAILQRAGAVD